MVYKVNEPRDCEIFCFRFFILFVYGAPDFYCKYFQQTERNSCVRLWTVLITDQLKRIFNPSSNHPGQMDFVISRFNSPYTVTPAQYYVDGDDVQGWEDSIWQLCHYLTKKFESEYGLIQHAKNCFESRS